MYESCEKSLEVLNSFRGMVRDVQSCVRMANDEIVEADKALGDIRHYCELHYPLTRPEKTKVVKLLKEYSDRRRRAKDALEMTGPLIDFLHNDHFFEGNLDKLAGRMAKSREKLQNRTYRPRVLKGLFEVEE